MIMKICTHISCIFFLIVVKKIVKLSRASDPVLKKLRILKLDHIYKYTVHLFVLKFRHKLLTKIYNNFFTRNDDVHSPETRSKQLFQTLFFRLDIGKCSVRATGVRISNYISQYVTLSDDADYPITNIKIFVVFIKKSSNSWSSKSRCNSP